MPTVRHKKKGKNNQNNQNNHNNHNMEKSIWKNKYLFPAIFLLLTIIAFSPIVLKSEATTSEFYSIPPLLIKGFIISCLFVLLTALYSKSNKQ